MLHIHSLTEGLELFKALGSEIRVEIVNILLENKAGMNMNELAAHLNITNGALTGHIKKPCLRVGPALGAQDPHRPAVPG